MGGISKKRAKVALKTKIKPAKRRSNRNKPDLNCDEKNSMVISDTEEPANENTIRRPTLLELIEENVLSREWLNDRPCDAVLHLIEEKTQFTNQSVLAIQYETVKECPKGTKSIQIVGGRDSRHWRCVFYDGSTNIRIYDSLRNYPLAKDEKHYLKRRFPGINCESYVFEKVQRQNDGSACGLFACAFATTLALGKKPCDVILAESDSGYWKLRRR